MAAMFEVYYALPRDEARESRLASQINLYGGSFTCAETSELPGVCGSVCLTFVFVDEQLAERAAIALHEQGEHVEGPGWYPD